MEVKLHGRFPMKTNRKIVIGCTMNLVLITRNNIINRKSRQAEREVKLCSFQVQGFQPTDIF